MLKPGEIVSSMIRRVLACYMKMLSIKVTGK